MCAGFWHSAVGRPVQSVPPAQNHECGATGHQRHVHPAVRSAASLCLILFLTFFSSLLSFAFPVVDCFCITLYSALKQTRCTRMWFYQWIAFYSTFLNIHRSGVLAALTWLVPHGTVPSQCILCTPYNYAPCHFMQRHLRKMYVCLAATSHLRFWLTNQGLLHATAVTWGWNRYQNKSQHRKLTLEKKILPPLMQGFEPATFWSRIWHS